MTNFIQKGGFRVAVQVFMLLLVVGIFLAACGGDDPTSPLYVNPCSTGSTYCSGSGMCCPNGFPYHCNSGGNSGTCYDTIPAAATCPTYDICSG